MPSIVLVAGDPSGDAQAARLITALKQRNASLTFSALGGPAMQQAGAALLDDLTTTAAIGPFDAARHLGRFTNAKRLFEEYVRSRHPDLAILVDFGDFNLPVIAPIAKRHGVPVLYYISPQVWAWGRFRLRYIRRYVERMIVLFPFEEAFYRREGIPVTWVGHPLMESAHPTMTKDDAFARFGLNPWRRTVGLLPGSRPHEVARHLPLMIKSAQRIAWQMPGVQFLLPKAPALPSEMLRRWTERAGVELRMAEGSVYDALQVMEAAVVASGTSTLDAALCAVPMAVVYRASWPTYLAARCVLRIPHIAMVNILAQRRLVPEFVQHRADPGRIARAIVELLRDTERASQVRQELRQVTQRLGAPGAVDRAATVVLEALRAAASTS